MKYHIKDEIVATFHLGIEDARRFFIATNN